MTNKRGGRELLEDRPPFLFHFWKPKDPESSLDCCCSPIPPPSHWYKNPESSVDCCCRRKRNPSPLPFHSPRRSPSRSAFCRHTLSLCPRFPPVLGSATDYSACSGDPDRPRPRPITVSDSTQLFKPPFLSQNRIRKFQAVACQTNPSLSEIEPSNKDCNELFDRTHRRSRGDGDYVDNKSKSVSEKYVTSMNQKYGEDPSAHPQFDPTAWCEVIGGPITTRTHTYGFGTRPHRIDLQQGIGYGHIPTQSSSASYSAYRHFPYPALVVTTSPSNSEVHQMKEDIKFIHTRFDNLEGKFDHFVDMIKNMMTNATNVGPPAVGPLGSGGQVNQ